MGLGSGESAPQAAADLAPMAARAASGVLLSSRQMDRHATCLLTPPSLTHPATLQARKGEADTTPDGIMAMVKAQCA